MVFRAPVVDAASPAAFNVFPIIVSYSVRVVVVPASSPCRPTGSGVRAACLPHIPCVSAITTRPGGQTFLSVASVSVGAVMMTTTRFPSAFAASPRESLPGVFSCPKGRRSALCWPIGNSRTVDVAARRVLSTFGLLRHFQYCCVFRIAYRSAPPRESLPGARLRPKGRRSVLC